PRTLAVQDYLTGGASLFEKKDPQEEHALMERLLEGVVVYTDGSISLQFHRDSLFAPLFSYDLRAGEGVVDLEKDRQKHREYFQGLQEVVAKSKGRVSEGTYSAHEVERELVYSVVYEVEAREEDLYLSELGGLEDEEDRIKTIDVPNGIRSH